MRIVVSICLLLALIACKKTVAVSDCIQSKVDEFKASEPCSSGASIKEYIFQNELVYVFEDGSCLSERGAAVWDANCSYLGYLGGFIVNTKIKGVNFETNATYIRTIWHN